MVRRLDLQHHRPLLRPVETRIARVPHVADADRAVPLVVQIPRLPVEELSLRHRRPRSQAQREREYETPRYERGKEGARAPGAAAREDDETGGEDQPPKQQLPPAPEEGPRPAGSDGEHRDGEQCAPRDERKGEQEAE